MESRRPTVSISTTLQGSNDLLLDGRGVRARRPFHDVVDQASAHGVGCADVRDRRHHVAAHPAGIAIRGYFAAWCLQGGAKQVASFEKSADVLWLRSLNPWSPSAAPELSLVHADVTSEIVKLPAASFDAALHDPPRFGIAGELYSQAFYNALAKVLKRGAPLFHYTGAPNKLTSGRDLASEVEQRLRTAGFSTRLAGDGVLARKT